MMRDTAPFLEKERGFLFDGVCTRRQYKRLFKIVGGVRQGQPDPVRIRPSTTRSDKEVEYVFTACTDCR